MARQQNQRKTGQRSFDIPAIFGRGIADLALLSVAQSERHSISTGFLKLNFVQK
jgi:hypothetical protein